MGLKLWVGRLLRFAAGFATGAVAVPAGLFLLTLCVWRGLAFASAFVPHPSDPELQLAFGGHGAELRQRGASDIVFESHDEIVRQHCRDLCDDISPPGSYGSVRVLDAGGRCIICRKGTLLYPLTAILPVKPHE